MCKVTRAENKPVDTEATIWYPLSHVKDLGFLVGGCCVHSLQEFLSLGSNLPQNSNPSHSSDHDGSLSHQRTPGIFFFSITKKSLKAF